MPNYTEYYNLIKPLPTENYDVNVANTNNTKIDEILKSKQEKTSGKDLSTNDFTDAYKRKLDALTMPYHYVGNVTNKTDLPKTSTNGYIYGVVSEGNSYIWNGTEWVLLGVLLDSSIYLTAEQAYIKSQVYNKTEVNTLMQQAVDEAQRKRGHIYGIKRSISSTSSSWTRTNDAEGLVANATKNGGTVVNNFDALYPWSNIISYNYDIKSKSITAFYGEPTFKFDGSNGEVLTRIPEFWYKREQKDGYEYIYIADYEAVGFIKSEQFSLGRYTMSGSSSRVYSKSGVNPLVSNTITNFRNYARNLNSDFGIMDWHYFVIQLLYLVEYADYNSQSKLGNGVNAKAWTGDFNGVSSGGCDSLGMKSGTLSDDNLHSVIYRGLEDIYAGLWQFVDGINIKDYVTYICYDSDKYSVDTFDGSYHAVGYTNFKTSGQWITKLGYDANNPLVAMPIEGNGSSSTGVCDLNWNAAGNMIALVGGGWGNGLSCGFWCWSCDDASSLSSVNVGARLLKNQ